MKLALGLISLLVSTAFAGYNCKCQDPSGTGPQWNDLTKFVCGSGLPGESIFCGKVYHADQHHQCTAATGCMDSGGFDVLCRARGAPGAYCWD